MKKELLDLVRYRKNVEESYENIPAEIFPCDYPNGKGPSIKELHGKYCLSYQSFERE